MIIPPGFPPSNRKHLAGTNAFQKLLTPDISSLSCEPRVVQINPRDSRRTVKMGSGTCLWFPVTKQQAVGTSHNKRNAV